MALKKIPHRNPLAAAALLFLPLIPALALAQAPGEHSAVLNSDCDRACLIDLTRRYLDAMVHKDRTRAPLAAGVRFSENNVEMPLASSGLWQSVSGLSSSGLELADPQTGNGAWFGSVQEGAQAALLTVRIRAVHRQIVEIETLIDRKGALPAPFGDLDKLSHDPAFSAPLSAAERRPRERLIAVANGYFSTVELNDGAIFTPFDPDCQRNENGISTTQGRFGAADIAQGCEAQFKLGIYRINKRVRERRYPLVDEERGIVLATGFFDHANTFDTYTTTDGKSHRTALKWPNSITLMEAFKIRNGMIYRIEAVFTYVPYFMHSPWAGDGQLTALQPRDLFATPAAKTAQAAGGTRRAESCEANCLIAAADQYMSSLVSHNAPATQWADSVGYTENAVSMMIGDGLWGSVSEAGSTPVYAVDPERGAVAWFGTVADHGQAAYYAMRLKLAQGGVAEVEAVIGRKGAAQNFADPVIVKNSEDFRQSAPKESLLPRARLAALIDRYYDQVQSSGGPGLRDLLDPQCIRAENGVTGPEAGASADPAAACLPLNHGTAFKPTRIRNRTYPVIDVAHGIVVAAGFADTEPSPSAGGANTATPAGAAVYPASTGFMEAFKVRNGRIYRIDSVATDLPYRMRSDWGR